MRKIASLFFLTLATWVITKTASALDSSGIDTHSIDRVSESTYRISGKDPYLVLPPKRTDTAAKFLVLGIRMLSRPTEAKQTYEVFFRSKVEDSARVFDPFYRLRFEAAESEEVFALAIPDGGLTPGQDYIRLDVDRCRACEFEITLYPEIVAEKPDDIPLVLPYRVYNGLNSISVDGLGISGQGWRANDLSAQDSYWQLDGIDPFLVSPPVDADTSALGGIRMVLETDVSTESNLDFQIFYATEQHGFVEQASSLLRIPNNPQGELEFVIPLEYLGSEHPRSVLLERIRIDFDSVHADARWRVAKIDLLHQKQMARLQGLIPDRLLQNKRQRAHGLALISKSIKKVISDLGFTIFYLLLLIATGFGFWRAFHK